MRSSLRAHGATVAVLCAAVIAIVAILLVTRHDNHAPLGSFATQHSRYSAPSTSSSSTGHHSKKWPRCDFDGNPANDAPGACPPWHGKKK